MVLCGFHLHLLQKHGDLLSKIQDRFEKRGLSTVKVLKVKVHAIDVMCQRRSWKKCKDSNAAAEPGR